MDIVIYAPGMPFDGETIYRQSLGGSETAAYYQARELARRGHRVSLYTNTQKPYEVFDGVHYCAIGPATPGAPLGEKFEYHARNTPNDVLIMQRHQDAYHRKFQAKICIWQTHDLALHRYTPRIMHGLWQMDAITCVSEWHRQQLLGVYPADPDFVKVVPNGVDLGLYEADPKRPEGLDGKFLLLYQARPERGLEHLVRPGGIMARLRKEAPNAHLLIVGYDNTQANMAPAYAEWFRMADQLPNVTRVGCLSKPALAQLQKACDLMIYPTEFEEVSCISAMEAMAAGLPLLASDHAALTETCKEFGGCLIPLKDGKADEDAFVTAVTATMEQHPEERDASGIRQRNAAMNKTWEKAVDALEVVIEDAFTRRRGSRAAQLKHFVEHGDIVLARELATNIDLSNPIETSIKAELAALYEFTESKSKFETHYRKHQGKYYDEFEERVVGEDVSNTLRFQGVAMYFDREAEHTKRPLRVMDYGCAHGHYIVPLAKHFSDWRFVGVDISGRAIAAAARWVQRDGLGNVSLIVGDEVVFKDLNSLCPLVQVADETEEAAVPDPAYARDLFDIIYAGEVLEHVPDPIGLLNTFLKVLRPGGVVIATTPLGRWEWSGYQAFKTGREHLWHFEKADIEEICADLDGELSCCPAGVDETGAAMGSWVWYARWDGTAQFKPYDRERKFKRLAPRQTISAALIIKDGERTLRKALDSAAGWVDEVVVAIDPATSDATREVIERWRVDNPWTPINVIEGVEALKEGFSAARNRSIAACHGDWILWFDADEEVQRPAEMWKFARKSTNRGFGFPQVHYAFDPPAVLTTDFPCRLFRNDRGIQFFGLVHEHPEEEMGKGVPFASIRSDTQFLHSGYVDEKTRRARFMRNLPLLKRDSENNSVRGLNRFLWLRDLAQGISFELEQTQGYILEGHLERAQQGIEIFKSMVEKDPPRLIADALPYYSQCVAVTGEGFDAELTMTTRKDAAPDLNASLKLAGRFHSREFLFQCHRRILEESTKFYEDKYF